MLYLYRVRTIMSLLSLAIGMPNFGQYWAKLLSFNPNTVGVRSRYLISVTFLKSFLFLMAIFFIIQRTCRFGKSEIFWGAFHENSPVNNLKHYTHINKGDGCLFPGNLLRNAFYRLCFYSLFMALLGLRMFF